MPTQLGTTVDLNDAKVIFSSAEYAGHYDADLRLRLLQALQTSLELETLFNLFFDHTQSAVAFDGFTYRMDLLDINLQFGKQSVHTCNYRLITQQDYLGELTFYRSRRFPEKDLAVLESLLNVVVFPLRNALMYREAISATLTDPLTGAGNKVALQNTLQREIELAERYSQTMSVLMLDLDKFKHTNERYGNPCGDEVLKQLVTVIKEEISGSDVVFRQGGEEFIVLLTNSSLAASQHIAERLRDRMVTTKLAHLGEEISTSISVGLSMLHPQDTVKRLLERAAYAMYSAKNDGRNRVKVCQEQVG
jgi:diguanylate cyclase (GGDEF)-like protein